MYYKNNIEVVIVILKKKKKNKCNDGNLIFIYLDLDKLIVINYFVYIGNTFAIRYM